MAVFSLLLLSAAALIAASLVRFERYFLLEEGEKRVASLAQSLAVSARDPLLARDELRLGPITESIMRVPDTVYAYVLDHRGIVAYHPDTELIGVRLEPTRDPQEDRVLKAVVPVTVEGRRVGTAAVGLSAEFVDRAVRTTAGALLWRLGLGTLVGLGGILLLTEIHVRRIARLEQAVRLLGAGDLRARAEVRGRDELARLAGGFNAMVEQLQEARREIERGVTETVSALASTIEVNDAYTHGHCERVARGTRAIAERLGVDGEKLHDFELAAILHDIGKIGIASDLLAKRDKLTEAEVRAVQEHAALGARILEAVSFLKQVAHYVRHHHEDWDGNGYPDGMVAEQAPLASRIIRVTDAYDAMTSGRPYRRAISDEEAIDRIIGASGIEFDPEIVDIFLELVAEGEIATIRRLVDQGLAA